MANTSRTGFWPVKHLNGSPYNGQCNVYECPAGEAIPVFVGDLVKLSDSATTSPYPACEAPIAAAAVAGPYVGVVVGVYPANFDPLTDNFLNTGDVTLIPNYRAASTKQFVLVADSPDLIFECQADGAVTNTSIGLNAGVVEGTGAASTGSTTTGVGGMLLDQSSINTTNTLPLQIMGYPNKPNNEINAASNKVYVRINDHAYSEGATGV